MSAREVKLAYVTQWAATKGILVVRDAKTTGDNDQYLSLRYVCIGPKDWTEDKAEAEKRYRAALARKIASAEKAIAKMRNASLGSPKYSEES